MRRLAVNLSIWHSRNLGGARAHLLYVNQEVAEDVSGRKRKMLPFFSRKESTVGELGNGSIRGVKYATNIH